MSSNDVPGSNPANNDVLKMGCWAEHKDGSLIFVKSTEGSRVIFEMFDTSHMPVTVFTDAMPLDDFNKHFSYPTKTADKWTWHDKTPFDWNRVIKAGARSGTQLASAADQLVAAARIAQALGLVERQFNPDSVAHMVEKLGPKAFGILDKIQGAIETLPMDKVVPEIKAGIEELKKLGVATGD